MCSLINKYGHLWGTCFLKLTCWS